MKETPEFYDKLKPKTPEIMERFSGELFKEGDIRLEESKFQKLFEKYGAEFKEALDEILSLWDSPEHRQTLGHDKIHISYDLFEYLKLTEGGELKESEKYMVLFGSLLHDLGRYPELLSEERSGAMDFSKAKQIQPHAALSGYMAALFAKKFKAEDEQDPNIVQASKAFNRRVIGAVLFHGGKNEQRDIVAHHVQSIDRLAGILGSREFVRNVVTDGVQRGAAVYPDERLSYDKAFPLFNNLPIDNFRESGDPKKSWTNIVHYLEMPMRNMYPLSTEQAMSRAKIMKRESGIILALLSGGKDSPLYKQIFAPELNEEEKYSFPKTKLPEDVWHAISEGLTEEENSAMEKYKDAGFQSLIDKMIDQQAPDISFEDRAKAHDLLNGVPENHQNDIYRAIEYVVARRELNKEEEVNFLWEMRNSQDPLIKDLAAHLLEGNLFGESESN